MPSLILLIIASFIIHPFHVSVCDIEFNKEAKAVQVSQRMFLDDLEVTLNKKYGTTLIIDDLGTISLRDSLLADYLDENLEIIVDGKVRYGKYLGSEIEEDGMWCYIEFEGIRKLKSIEITNTVLIETFDDQANIIHFKAGEFEKSTKLDKQRHLVKITPDA
ncbi:MAG: DUF6702 family protein [Bacteroidota bacterium]